jgi:hypothetical protein
MSVNAISQSHVPPAENTLSHASPKAQSAGSKANTAQAPAGASRAQQAEETKAAATTQNNAGQEQEGSRQKNGGQGGRVNLYA